MNQKHSFWVYILTNKHNRVLYTGITNNIHTRLLSHRRKDNPVGFSTRYNCWKLVYMEEHRYIKNAISREKQIKAGNRARKVALIESINPDWRDLAEGWFDD